MMRAYGTQVIRFRANLFVHEPPVAGYIDARISVIGMVQFVIVEKRVTVIRHEEMETFLKFLPNVAVELFVLPLEFAVPFELHDQFSRSAINSSILENVLIFFPVFRSFSP